MKAKLIFNLEEPEEIAAHRRAVSATDAYIALSEIANEIFRPARKHGYPETILNKLIEVCPDNEEGYNVGSEIISQLETKFYEILTDNKISLEDLD